MKAKIKLFIQQWIQNRKKEWIYMEYMDFSEPTAIRVFVLVMTMCTLFGVLFCVIDGGDIVHPSTYSEECRQSCHVVGSSFKDETSHGCFCVDGTIFPPK